MESQLKLGEMQHHQLTCKDSLKANAPLKSIPSDHSSPTYTSYSSSKLIFDNSVNKFQIEEFHSNNLRKQTICDVNSQYNICQKQSHSEITYPHTTSESYQCFYLSDDNNQEPEPLIINIDDNCSKQIINNKETIVYENYFEYNSPKNSIHSTTEEDEQNSFYLFNEHESSSDDDECETEMEAKYKINVPTISIPKSKKEFIPPIRPAFKLHLEMVDDDGSIKRQIIKHRKQCQNYNMKEISNKSDKMRNKLKKRKRKKRKKKYMRSFRHWMSNVVDYLVTENTRDLNLTVNIDTDYFID